MRKNKKAHLVNAAIILFSQKGIAATSIREISSHAGVTEGAIYRHFKSKQELSWYAFKQVIEEMAREKEYLAHRDLPFEKKLYEWVHLSYAYYDRAPEAFTYVLLMPEAIVDLDQDVTSYQGELFKRMFREARDQKRVRDLPAEVALSHHTGLMLNVPRLINDEHLSGPAISYVDEVAHAIWRTLERTN